MSYKAIYMLFIISIIWYTDIISKESISDDLMEIKKEFGNLYPPKISSTLEDAKYPHLYDSKNLIDNNEKTAWCTDKGPAGEYILAMNETKSIENYDEIVGKQIEIKLKVFNGYGKTSELYYANNRIKKATLRIFETTTGTAQDWKVGTFIKKGPVLTKEIVLEFEDKPMKQIKEIPVKLQMSLDKKDSGSAVHFISKLIINEVYKGNKYNDTCISEFHVQTYPVDPESRKNMLNFKY